MPNKPKTVFLTGAAGFIGSHTAEALLKRGDTVIGLDNLNDYYDPQQKRQNLQDIRSCVDASPGHLHWLEADIRDPEAVGKALDQHKPDAIVHLAAMPGVRASTQNPRLYYDVNLGGTLNLLEAARTASVQSPRSLQSPDSPHSPLPNFVFASTSSVYGRTQTIPFVETDPCDRPLAPYPASKRAAELLGHSYHHLYGLNFTALRFFTVYGPRNRPDMMPYLILNNIFFRQQVPLYNKGDMRRDWTYVDDIVSGILAATDNPLGYEIINLGRGSPTLLSDFVKLVENLAGKPANLTPTPMPEADVTITYADTTKAEDLLGYAPNVPLEQGIRHFWEWYKKAVLERG